MDRPSCLRAFAVGVLAFCAQRLSSPLAASRVCSTYFSSFPAFTMAYWKAAGMSYLQYVNLATTALRNTVKPSLAARYAIKEDVHYKKQAWINSKPQEKRQTNNAGRKCSEDGRKEGTP